MIDFTAITSFGPVIPFFFVLGVVYGSLHVADVFKGHKGVNFIIAVSIAMIAMTNYEVINFINGIIPYATIAFIIVFAIMFLKKTVFSGLSGAGASKDSSLPIIILMFVFIFLSNVSSASSIPYMGGIFNEQFLVIAGLGLVLLIFYLAYKKPAQ